MSERENSRDHPVVSASLRGETAPLSAGTRTGTRAFVGIASTKPMASTKTAVGDRFARFLERLALTTNQREDGQIKHHAVRKCLNRNYWNLGSDTENSMLIG